MWRNLRKIIIFLLSLGIILVSLFFLLRFELKENKLGFKETLTSFLGEKTTAQIFFPRYSQRLKYLVSEIAFLSEEITNLNQKLNNTLKTCDCRYTQSQCLQALPREKEPADLEIDLPLPPFFQTSKNQLENQAREIENKLDNLNEKLNQKIEEKLQEIERFSLKNNFPNFFSLKIPSLGVLLNEEEKDIEEIKKEIRYLKKAQSKVLSLKETISQLPQSLEKLERDLEESVKNKIEENLTLEVSEGERKGKSLEELQEELENNLKAWLDFLENDLANFIPAGTENLENNLNNQVSIVRNDLEKLFPETILEDFQRELESSLRSIEESLNNLENQFQRNIENLENQLKNFIPDMVNKLKEDFQGILNEAQSLLTGWQTGNCQIGEVRVFGEPCPQREELEENQLKIKSKIAQLTYLRKLLKTEMNFGLEKELATLEPEEAQELKDNLEKLVNLTSPLSQFNSLAKENSTLPTQCLAENCQANCQGGTTISGQVCLIGAGKQEPIGLKFKIGARLSDLEFGEVGIKNLDFNLPAKIKFPALTDLPAYTIPLPEVFLNLPSFPLEKEKIPPPAPLTFFPPTPPAPEYPEVPHLTLSCPQFPGSSFSPNFTSPSSKDPSIETEWYFQTFSWLTEKCQELPGMRGYGEMLTEKVKNCFDKENLLLTIIEECNWCWKDYHDKAIFGACSPPKPIPQICQELGDLEYGQAQSLEKNCQDLFKDQGKEIPAGCNLEKICPGDWGFTAAKKICREFEEEENRDKCCFTKESKNKVLNTFKKECEKLRKIERKKQVPQPCKILPLFTQEIPQPSPESYLGSSLNTPAQTIRDYPSFRIDCPSPPLPEIPKIVLPDIIIPDIELPDINFPPLLVKCPLPDFIFEDLILPDIELCDLNACKDLFPDLDLQFPMLYLPEIELPTFYFDLEPIYHPILGELEFEGPLKIEMGKIQYPPLLFPLPPEMFDLDKLVSFQLELPSIKMPSPQLFFEFQGLDIDIFGLALGLIDQFLFSVPDFNVCVGLRIKAYYPLECLKFPDFRFSWPAFPEFPEIPFCKDIRAFCRQIKTTLQETKNQVEEIEEEMNKTIQREIQARLDRVAQKAQDFVKKEIEEKIKEKGELIKEKIREMIRTGQIENGFLKFKPVSLSLGNILIPSYPLKEKAQIPEEIPIPWPERLKKFTLSQKITYQIPSLPLKDKLSYQKEFTLNLPGLYSLDYSLGVEGLFEKYPSCKNQVPTGGNPCPLTQIESNIQQIQNIKKEIQTTSQKIREILK